MNKMYRDALIDDLAFNLYDRLSDYKILKKNRLSLSNFSGALSTALKDIGIDLPPENIRVRIEHRF